jgi:lipoprotein-anchoring transpeptidase ErfK/SrfK
MGRTRINKGLVAVVGVGIVVGAVAVLHKTDKSKAHDESNKTAADASSHPKTGDAADKKPAPKNTGQIALPGASKPLITQTPGEAPVATAALTAAKPGAPVAAKPLTVAAAPVAPRPAPAPNNADPAVSAKALADGKAQVDAGQLIAGRTILNEALTSGQFTDADAQAAKDLMSQVNDVLIFSPRRFPEDPYQTSYQIQAGDRPIRFSGQFSSTWEFIGRVNGIKDARRLRQGQTLKIIKGPFHAVVSKTTFQMDMYLGSPGEKGSLYVRSFPVGLGRSGSTPTGTWMLQPQGKLKNPKWWGTGDEPMKEADDPQNPLGEFWMGLVGTDGDALGKEGFGIHGTIDPDSIGKEMSHGCIRLVNDNVERVYEMLIDGKSTVIVKP